MARDKIKIIMKKKDKIIQEYRGNKKEYESFLLKIENLMKELLTSNKINPHQITCRCKEISSLEKKIIDKEEKYECLNDITDIIGIRIITYFEDEVDKIASVIEKEFTVDKENSIDKRKLESDRFGYKSLHYVINLNEDRLKLTEYKNHKSKKVEIQIRSILQHAWAEIEHDIGYKSINAIPEFAKRNFFRIAALLEVADNEFVRLKSELSQYEKEVPDAIMEKPDKVLLDKASLNSFIESKDIVKNIDLEIITKLKTTFLLKEIPSKVDKYLERLKYLRVENIDELENKLIHNKDQIVRFSIIWNKNIGQIKFPHGISIFYLCYVLVASSGNFDYVKEYCHNFLSKKSNINDYDKDATEILSTYNEVVSQK